MIVRLLVLQLVASSLLGCKPEPRASPPEVPPSVAAAQTTAPTSEPRPSEPTVPFAGEPVGVTPVEILHRNGELVVQRQRWKLGESTGWAWLVSVPSSADVRVVASEEVVPFGEFLPSDAGPWAAINGGFYEEVPDSDRHRPMGLVVADGQTRSELKRRGGSGVFYVDQHGPRVVHRSDFSAAPSQALQSIDRIVDEGASVVKRRDGQPGAMRSAVAVAADKLWLVVAAADADIAETPHGVQLSRSGAGLPLWAFAEYVLAATNATEALNLDGGISTQLAVRDEDYSLAIAGVRGTINAVVVRPVARARPKR